jgi:hypothetical protein
MEPKKKEEKEKEIPLPFSGEIVEQWCHAIKKNHGLMSQCREKREEGMWCKKCDKEAKKNEGIPKEGRIEERMEKGCDYKDEKGKEPISYRKVMKKLNLTEEEVMKEVETWGVKFDMKHFDEEEKKKGRPKKEKEEEEEKKDRGRPKKEKKNIEVEKEDLFATLMKEAMNEKGKEEEEQKMNEDSEEEEEEVEEIRVKRVEVLGKIYMKCMESGDMYDEEELVGRWDEELGMIERIEK